MGAAAQLRHVQREAAWYNKTKRKFARIGICSCRDYIKDYFKINRRMRKVGLVEMFNQTLECILTMIVMEIDDRNTIGLGNFFTKVGAAMRMHDPIEWGVVIMQKMEKIKILHIGQLLLRHRTVNMELINVGQKTLKGKTFEMIMDRASVLVRFKQLKGYEYGVYNKFIGNNMESSDSETSEDRKPWAVDMNHEANLSDEMTETRTENKSMLERACEDLARMVNMKDDIMEQTKREERDVAEILAGLQDKIQDVTIDGQSA